MDRRPRRSHLFRRLRRQPTLKWRRPRRIHRQAVPTTPSAPAATTENQQAAGSQISSQNSQPTAADNSVKSPKTPTKSQAKMMGDQLNAPTQIPQDAEKQAAENAPPPSFDAAGADGLGGSGANASALNGHAQPVVKFVPPKPIAVSSGVATGMLIQSTPPVYPSIAKAARVGGTVVAARHDFKERNDQGSARCERAGHVAAGRRRCRADLALQAVHAQQRADRS